MDYSYHGLIRWKERIKNEKRGGVMVPFSYKLSRNITEMRITKIPYVGKLICESVSIIIITVIIIKE